VENGVLRIYALPKKMRKPRTQSLPDRGVVVALCQLRHSRPANSGSSVESQWVTQSVYRDALVGRGLFWRVWFGLRDSENFSDHDRGMIEQIMKPEIATHYCRTTNIVCSGQVEHILQFCPDSTHLPTLNCQKGIYGDCLWCKRNPLNFPWWGSTSRNQRAGNILSCSRIHRSSACRCLCRDGPGAPRDADCHWYTTFWLYIDYSIIYMHTLYYY